MKKHVQMICILLSVCMIFAFPVSADSEPQTWASLYFSIHDCYLYKVDSSTFEIWYDVTATATIMQELGVSSIEVERSADGENWSIMRTYDAEDYPEMIRENAGTHEGYITYRYATPGYYYRAYITFYAKNSSGIGERGRYTAVLHM